MPYHHLPLSERETIANMHFAGHGPTAIGRALNRSHSTILREIGRNKRDGQYRSSEAQQQADSRRRRRPMERRLDHEPLREKVCQGLCRGWSPEEIAGRLKVDHEQEGDPE